MKQLEGMTAIWVEVERLKSCNLNQSWMKARWRFERWRFELCQMNSFYESFTKFDVHFLWKCFPELGLFWTVYLWFLYSVFLFEARKPICDVLLGESVIKYFLQLQCCCASFYCIQFVLAKYRQSEQSLSDIILTKKCSFLAANH